MFDLKGFLLGIVLCDGCLWISLSGIARDGVDLGG